MCVRKLAKAIASVCDEIEDSSDSDLDSRLEESSPNARYWLQIMCFLGWHCTNIPVFRGGGFLELKSGYEFFTIIGRGGAVASHPLLCSPNFMQG